MSCTPQHIAKPGSFSPAAGLWPLGAEQKAPVPAAITSTTKQSKQETMHFTHAWHLKLLTQWVSVNLRVCVQFVMTCLGVLIL